MSPVQVRTLRPLLPFFWGGLTQLSQPRGPVIDLMDGAIVFCGEAARDELDIAIFRQRNLKLNINKMQNMDRAFTIENHILII